MENIISIIGKVKYSITLDPSVWIFDERKLELTAFFDEKKNRVNDLEEYTKSISQHWDREIIEGAAVPSVDHNEKKFVKELLLTGTFGIRFEPFLQNAEPYEEAKTVVIESIDNKYSIPIEDAKELILCFSKVGKPLKEDGPIHVYFSDGSNKDQPIKNIRIFRIE
jgi:hypothetical protein